MRASVGPRRLREVPLSWARAPVTTDVLRAPRRGTSSACHLPRGRHWTQGHFKNATCAPKDASFTRSSDSCSSIATTHRRGNSFGGGAAWAISRSGKPTQVGGTGSGVVETGRSAARRTEPLPQGRGRFRVRTGRWSWPPSQRGTRARVRARTSVTQFAEVGRRHLASNKLGIRAPKRADRVE
jgi:hypothetical protein